MSVTKTLPVDRDNSGRNEPKIISGFRTSVTTPTCSVEVLKFHVHSNPLKRSVFIWEGSLFTSVSRSTCGFTDSTQDCRASNLEALLMEATLKVPTTSLEPIVSIAHTHGHVQKNSSATEDHELLSQVSKLIVNEGEIWKRCIPSIQRVASKRIMSLISS